MGRQGAAACGAVRGWSACLADRPPKVRTRAARPTQWSPGSDGAPVYRSDVLREAANRGVTADPATSAALTEQLVDRKLLADEAVKTGSIALLRAAADWKRRGSGCSATWCWKTGCAAP